MKESNLEESITNIAFGAIRLLNRWKAGREELDTVALYYILSLAREFGLPQDDPILRDLDRKLFMGRHEQRYIAMLRLALNRFGMLDAAQLQQNLDFLHRGARGFGEIPPSLNTRFGPDPIRDWTCALEVVAKSPAHHSRLGKEHWDGIHAREVEFSRQLGLLKLSTQKGKASAQGWRSPFFATYFCMVRSHLAPLGNSVVELIREQFESNLDFVRKSKRSWHQDLRGLEEDCLVLQHSMRIGRRTTGRSIIRPESKQELWRCATQAIYDYAIPAFQLDSVDPLRLSLEHSTLCGMLCFARAHAYSQNRENDQKYRRVLVKGSEHVLRSIEKAAEGSRQSSLYESHHREKGLLELIKHSLEISVVQDRLTGGQSGSEVYDAHVTFLKPFVGEPKRIVFKTDVKKEVNREKSNFDQLKERNLHAYFAQVLTTDKTVTIGDKEHLMVIYEHLIGFQTLRRVLADAEESDLVASVLRQVFSTLAKICSESAIRTDSVDTGKVALSDLVKHLAASIRSNVDDMDLSGYKQEFRDYVSTLQEASRRLVTRVNDVRKGMKWQVDPSLMHGDLNAGNIMLRITSDGGQAQIRVIDYESLTFSGHCLVDCGQLLEDAVADGFLPGSLAQTVEGDMKREYREQLGLKWEQADNLLVFHLSRLKSIAFRLKKHFQMRRDEVSLPTEMTDRWQDCLRRCNKSLNMLSRS